MIIKYEYLSKRKISLSQHFSLLLINKFRLVLHSINDNNNIIKNYKSTDKNKESYNKKTLNTKENSNIIISSKKDFVSLKEESIINDSSSNKKSWSFEINENLNSSNFEDDSNNSMHYSISDKENNIVNK